MALTYTGTNGLFNRLGALVYMMDAVRTHQANLKTLLDNVENEYSAADQYMVANLSAVIDSRIAEAGGILFDIQRAAERTIVEMAWAEASSSTTNLMKTKTIDDALTWLIEDMDATSNSIDGTTISTGSLSTGSKNIGNGTLSYLNTAAIFSTASKVGAWPNIRTELVVARCVQDAQDNAVLPGTEVFRVYGSAAYPNLDYRFPAGSATDMMLSSTTAAVDAGARGQNILTNSDLEDWTSNIPNQWTVSSGTAGTDFLQETTTKFRGSSAMKLAVTGNLFNIRQRIGSVDGTVGTLLPDRPYVLAFAAKKDASATGIMRISLKDASGTIIDGTAWKIDQNIASLTTGWTIYTLERRTPKNLATPVYLHVEMTTAIGTAAAYIDEIVLAEMMPIAPGGPALSLIVGSNNWLADDWIGRKWTNNAEGAFATAFDRLFAMYERGLSLPSNYSGTETISDSLIA